jgi:hypothetical protein
LWLSTPAGQPRHACLSNVFALCSQLKIEWVSMENDALIRCRLVACRGLLGTSWKFYLINDGDEPIDSAVLIEIGHEWGNLRGIDSVNVTVSNITPGQHKFVCSDDASAEGRMDLLFRVMTRGREATLSFEFPKLYKLTREHLRPVEGLGKRGYAVSAESPAR